MTSINGNDNIFFNAINLSGKTQLGGTSDAKSEKSIDYNDGLTLFEMQDIDKNFGNGDGVMSYEELAKAFNGDKSYKLTSKDKNHKSVVGKLFDKISAAFKKTTLKNSISKGTKASEIKNAKYDSKTKTISFTAGNSTITMKGNKVTDKITTTKNKTTGQTTTVKNDGTKVVTTGSNAATKATVTLSKNSVPTKIEAKILNTPISDIKFDKQKGFTSLKIGNSIYSQAKATKNSDGSTTYTMTPNPADGSKVVVKKTSSGAMEFTTYGKNSKRNGSVSLDKNGNPAEVLKCNDKGQGVKRYYCNKNLTREYSYDSKGKLSESYDYKDGSKNPSSKQTYVQISGIGSKWGSRTEYTYDKNGKASVAKTYSYNYDTKTDPKTGLITLTETREGKKGKTSTGTRTKIITGGHTTEVQTKSGDGKTTNTTKYNADGTKKSTETKKDNVTTTTNYENGKVSDKTIIDNKNKTKDVQKFSNGILAKTTRTYANRPKDSVVTEYKNGKILSQITKIFKNGKLTTTKSTRKYAANGYYAVTTNGKTKYFNKNGKSITETEYKSKAK